MAAPRDRVTGRGESATRSPNAVWHGLCGMGRAARREPVVDDTLLEKIAFNADGLVPVIAQQHDTGEVLMMAWMNRDAIAETLDTRRLCYYSRSRAALWRKGESSGQVQNLIELRLDCDGDTLLALVDQTGVACHTGRRSCFFTAIDADGAREIAPVLVSPETLYGPTD